MSVRLLPIPTVGKGSGKIASRRGPTCATHVSTALRKFVSPRGDRLVCPDASLIANRLPMYRER
jgi:hypothetical protein